MTRQSVAGAIVLVWVGALSWLGWREFGADTSSVLDDSARTIPPGAAYYALMVGETAVGYAAHTVDTVPTGVQVDERQILELPTDRGVVRTTRRTLFNLSNRLELRDFETTVASERAGYTLRGVVTDDSILGVELSDGLVNTTSRVDIAPGIALSEFLPLRLAFRNELVVGDTIAATYLDGTSLRETRTMLFVAADSQFVFPDSAAWDSLRARWVPARWDTIPAFEVRSIDRDGPASMWVGVLGQILGATYESGVTVQRTAFEVAFHNFRLRSDSGSALLRAGGVFGTAIAQGVTALDDPRSEFRIQLQEPVPEAMLADQRQSLVGETLLIQAEPRDVVDPTLRIPIAGTAALIPYMRPDAVIRSRDPRIQAQARLAIDGTTRANRAAQRLTRWVYENLDKRATVGVPSALHVLESGAGDSYEHAILYVSLARAVGLPARTVSGMLYVNGRFYYHNWAEVHLGRGWLAVDPTFGQHPADASHISVAPRGQPSDFEMFRLIGKMRLEAVSDGE